MVVVAVVSAIMAGCVGLLSCWQFDKSAAANLAERRDSWTRFIVVSGVAMMALAVVYFCGRSDQGELLQPTLVVGRPMRVLEVYHHPADGHRVAIVSWRKGREHKISWLDADRLTVGGPYSPGTGPEFSKGEVLVLQDDQHIAQLAVR